MNALPMKPLIITLLAVAVALLAHGAEPVQLKDKTLVVWVAPANLTQQGGSVLTIEDDQSHFDGIFFGEIAPAKWMPGSDFHRRTLKGARELAGRNSRWQNLRPDSHRLSWARGDRLPRRAYLRPIHHARPAADVWPVGSRVVRTAASGRARSVSLLCRPDQGRAHLRQASGSRSHRRLATRQDC